MATKPPAGRKNVAVIAVLIVLLLLMTAALAFTLRRRSAYVRAFENIRFPRVLMSDLYPRLKPGDLVMFSASTRETGHSIFTQCFYTHAAIITRGRQGANSRMLFVSESCSRGYPHVHLTRGGHGTHHSAVASEIESTGHARVTPLMASVGSYAGRAFVSQLAAPLTEKQSARLDEFHDRPAKPYPGLVAGVLLDALGVRRDTAYCFDHIFDILADIHLLPQSSDLANVRGIRAATRFHELIGLPLADNVYAPVREIVYDVDTTDVSQN